MDVHKPSREEFETHVTVRAPCAAEDVTRLREWASSHELKFTHIILARGRTPSQPMLTRHGHGTLADEHARAAELAAALGADGFDVTRVKIEAAPWNVGVPRTDAAAAADPPQRYFEHHVKLLLPVEADAAPIVAVARPHGAHVSHNALRRRDDGRQERFVTQRVHRQGRAGGRLFARHVAAPDRAATDHG